jgi:hypothetical protein
MLRWLARMLGKAGASTTRQAADVRPAPEGDGSPGPREYILAEVSFSREDTCANYISLGRALMRCRERFPWITGIAGLDELLRGECPGHWSKAVSDGPGRLQPYYDPILVWGRGIQPGQAIEFLGAEIPSDLGSIHWPDPDNGL